MALFNMFGEQEHRVFNYKPIYYDQEKEERRQMFGKVDGTVDKEMQEAKEKGTYVPGSYIKGSLRDGKYQKSVSAGSKAQNIIGVIGLILVIGVLMYILKFYSLL